MGHRLTGELVVDSVCKRFGERTVLAGATVAVREGRITALLGRNGEGKSTLLSIMAGLKRADQGSVRLDGEHVARPSLPWLARRGVFLLGADRLPLSPAHTLGTHLAAIHARYGDGAAGPDVLGVSGLLDRLPASFSGGERKRAAMAMALARSPRFLLLDEPFRDLAPLDAERVALGVLRLAERGAGVIVTGHETAIILDLADEVTWLVSGTTHGLGSPATAREHWAFRREFLGITGRSTP